MSPDAYEHLKKSMIAENKKGKFWIMGNEERANEYFAEVKKEFPELCMYKIGVQQFFCMNNRAKKKLKALISKRIADLEHDMQELKNTLSEVEENDVHGRN